MSKFWRLVLSVSFLFTLAITTDFIGFVEFQARIGNEGLEKLISSLYAVQWAFIAVSLVSIASIFFPEKEVN